jgi:hypothetical protein
MAFQCEEELDVSTTIPNTFEVTVTQAQTFALTDIIWIEGKVSTSIFDTAVDDFIFNENPETDFFSIYKLIQPVQLANSRDAIDKFELVFESGAFDFLPSCSNATMIAFPELEENNEFYSYRIGLKPLEAGDYVISWKNATLQNTDRNEFIINAYSNPNDPNIIGFDNCGIVSTRFLNESEREFYFAVTE